MRILEFTIGGAETGWSVEHFLRTRLQFGKKQISRLKFRKNGIRLNGEQCRTSAVLSSGDRLTLTLDETGKRKRDPEGYVSSETDQNRLEGDTGQTGEESGKCSWTLQILYEDEDLLAVYKPGGIAVHPSHGHSRDTLWNRVVSLEEERGETWTPRILGRLDKDTEGIILLAKTTEAAAALAVQREKKLLRKQYIALAEGVFKEKDGWILSPVEKDPEYLNRMRIGQNGLKAGTHYCVLEEQDGRSLLLLELEEGRTHQIRVHLSSEGHPLVGDCIYHMNPGEGNLHLCAWKLHFQKPFTGEEIEIALPLPGWAGVGQGKSIKGGTGE